MSRKTLTFRASFEFAEQTRFFAKSANLPLSAYISEAVREKNERQIAARMRFLSRRLGAESARVNREFEAAAETSFAP
ncbi:MAG: antitoxin of toxin-antitoxin stability system [Burkholderiaceae bacterium]|nr:antitoxin of toxin-antitoxin stability system [Burkholderiaceae bacterium]